MNQLSFDSLLQARKQPKWFKRRLVDGVEQFCCTNCDTWKTRDHYPARKGRWGIETVCKPCTRIKRNAYRERRRDHLESHRRDRRRVRAKELRQIAKRIIREGCPMTVDREVVLPFMDDLVKLFTKDGVYDAHSAAHAAKTSTRTLSAVRGGERSHMRWEVAESIAMAVGREDEFCALFPMPGIDGWSKHGDRWCRGCGRFNVLHFARGFCSACYSTDRKSRLAA